MPERKTWVKRSWRSPRRTNLMTHPQPPAREFGDYSLHVMHSISLSLGFGTAAVGGFLGVDSKQALHFEENSEIFCKLLWACTGMTGRPFKTFTSLEKVSKICRKMSAVEQLKVSAWDVGGQNWSLLFLRLCSFMLKVLSLLGGTDTVRAHKLSWFVVDSRKLGRGREAKGHHQHCLVWHLIVSHTRLLCPHCYTTRCALHTTHPALWGVVLGRLLN